jgi:hypothetical protein
MPKIIINGWVAVVGRAPDKDELIDLILAALEDTIIRKTGNGGRAIEQSA